jgi:hypothetical protein
LKVNQHFGGTCRFHLQGQRISKARKLRESGFEAEPLLSRWFLAWQHIPPKLWFTFNGLQKIEIFNIL